MVGGAEPLGRQLGAALIVASSIAAVLAAPARASDWLYTVRPGDNLWAIAERFLRTPSRWLALGRHNGLRQPDELEPGTLLRIPVAWLQVRPAAAELVTARGAVELRRSDGSGGPARAGDRIEGGELLITGADGVATVRLADGTRLEVGPDSRLAFDRLSAYGRTGMIDTRLGLATGRVRASVARGSGGLAIETPAASAAVRGTVFRLASDPTGTRAEGLEGKVEVEAAGIARSLRGGTGTTIRPGTPPAPVRPLLPPPRADGPADTETVPQRIRLEPLEGAIAYRLELLGGPAGETLLLSRVGERPELRFDVANGRYRLRARGIDARGLEGLDLEQEIRVHARPEPPVPLRPRPDGIERGDRPRFAWAAPEGALAYRFELGREGETTPLLAFESAEPGLTTPMALPPGRYRWRVATLREGETGPFGPSWRFELRPPSPAPEAAPSFAEEGLVLRWPELEPGQRREVQLATETSFAEIRVAKVVEGAELTLPWPDPGRWYLRTRILEAEGEPGPWSTPQAIDVPWRSLWPLAIPLLLAVAAALL